MSKLMDWIKYVGAGAAAGFLIAILSTI